MLLERLEREVDFLKSEIQNKKNLLDYSSLIIPIIMLKVMNELRFKIQDKHIFIYHEFNVFISTPSLYSIYFTPFCLCETFLDLLR